MNLDIKKSGLALAGAGLVTALAISGTAAFADDATTEDSTTTDTTTTETDHRGPHHLTTAAEYLGLTETELFAELEAGKTLAEVAEAQGKSVDGLVDALVAEAEADITEMVNSTMPERPEGMGGHHGHGGHGGPFGGPDDVDDSTTTDSTESGTAS